MSLPDAKFDEGGRSRGSGTPGRSAPHPKEQPGPRACAGDDGTPWCWQRPCRCWSLASSWERWRTAIKPLTDGGAGVSTLAYPGLPAAQGVRIVNTLGGVHDDVYVPPQRSTFYLFADIANYGSRAVTIESVTLPRDTALTPAGHVLYARPPSVAGAPAIPSASHVLHDVRLAAGQSIFVAIPVRLWPCWVKYSGFTTVPNFKVTYRYIFFRHTVAIPWGIKYTALIELIMHVPEGRPGQPDVVCARG